MPPTPDPHHAKRWWILALLGVAQLMVVLDATIVNIALPSAQHALGFSDDARQWVVTGYALAFGSLLLLGGRISDLFGRKWTLIGGLAGFALASAVGGAAPSFGVLVASRAVQGAFGALLAPAALSLLSTTFTHPGERNRAFAIYGGIAGAGGAVGLLLGGILTEYLSWRWCLYVNLLFAVPALVAAAGLLHNQAEAAGTRIDLPGVLTSGAGLFALVYGLTKANTDGWGATVTLAFLAAAVVLLAAFAVIQTRAQHPLLPLRVVIDRNRGGAYLAVLAVGAGMFGVFLFLTYYLQQTLGFSPVETGLAFLPMVVVLAATAGIAQTRILPRTGPRPLIALGLLVAAAGMAWLAQVTPESTYAANVLPALLVEGAGIGLAMATAMGTATLGVTAGDAGIASATVNTSQQIGGSIGTALLSTLAASAATSYGSHGPAAAAVHGYTTAFWWAAAIFAIGAVLCGLLLRGGVPEEAPAGELVMAH
jgi:EmrB/QacA subfamily drug resistance transporter